MHILSFKLRCDRDGLRKSTHESLARSGVASLTCGGFDVRGVPRTGRKRKSPRLSAGRERREDAQTFLQITYWLLPVSWYAAAAVTAVTFVAAVSVAAIWYAIIWPAFDR